MGIAFALIFILLEIALAVRIFLKFFSKEKTVTAVIVDKQNFDKQVYGFTKAPCTKKEYVITFLVNGKKKYFNVSEFSYGNYRLNQKGKLTYKGNRIINFK